MPMTIVQDTPPLTIKPGGVVRVGGTRVPLDTVAYAYDTGASPEEIVERFPSLELPDVYATIAYVLRHRGEVDAYLAERKAEAEEIRRKVEAQPGTIELRRRLRERRDRH